MLFLWHKKNVLTPNPSYHFWNRNEIKCAQYVTIMINPRWGIRGRNRDIVWPCYVVLHCKKFILLLSSSWVNIIIVNLHQLACALPVIRIGKDVNVLTLKCFVYSRISDMNSKFFQLLARPHQKNTNLEVLFTNYQLIWSRLYSQLKKKKNMWN